MRALVLVVATIMCACKPDAAVVAPHDPAVRPLRVAIRIQNAPADPPASPAHSVHGTAPAAPTPAALACFAEPVTYTKAVTVKPMAGDADKRLLQCDTSAGGDARACRFGVAREYFEANRFERAGPLLLAVAYDATAADAGLAAQLAFESMNMLGSAAALGRPSCYELMAEELPKLLNELCMPNLRHGAEEVCGMLHIADADIVSCSECTGSTTTGRDRHAAYVAAGQIYLRLANDRCIFGKGPQKRNEELRCDEFLFRAHFAFSWGNDLSHAAQAKAMLVNPRNGLQQTEFAKRLVEFERDIERRRRDAQLFIRAIRRP